MSIIQSIPMPTGEVESQPVQFAVVTHLRTFPEFKDIPITSRTKLVKESIEVPPSGTLTDEARLNTLFASATVVSPVARCGDLFPKGAPYGYIHLLFEYPSEELSGAETISHKFDASSDASYRSSDGR